MQSLKYIERPNRVRNILKFCRWEYSNPVCFVCTSGLLVLDSNIFCCFPLSTQKAPCTLDGTNSNYSALLSQLHRRLERLSVRCKWEWDTFWPRRTGFAVIVMELSNFWVDRCRAIFDKGWVSSCGTSSSQRLDALCARIASTKSPNLILATLSMTAPTLQLRHTDNPPHSHYTKDSKKSQQCCD